MSAGCDTRRWLWATVVCELPVDFELLHENVVGLLAHSLQLFNTLLRSSSTALSTLSDEARAQEREESVPSTK